MQVNFSGSTTLDAPNVTLAVPVFADEDHAGTLAELDKATGGHVRRAMETGRFIGKPGTSLDVFAPTGLQAERLHLVGMGPRDEATTLDYERFGGRAAAAVLTRAAEHLVLAMTGSGNPKVDEATVAARAALGAGLRNYHFDTYLTTLGDEDRRSLTTLTVSTAENDAARREWDKLSPAVAANHFTRDLCSEPANVLFPESFAERCEALADLGVEVEVLGEDQLSDIGMNALLAVGRGSRKESKVVIMRWKGADTDPVALVGKGVCFDSGGISIKPAGGMEDMKWDMGGAAAVAGAMHMVAARKAKAHVIGIIGLVENMPDGDAQRPGDVVTSMSGQTIEVLNTDAEGRLVLADCMTYVQTTYKPKAMVDLATLTGAILISLGHEYAGLFSNDDALSMALSEAGNAVGEPVWRLPMGEGYDAQLKSPIADMKNIGGREAGSITAAQFLKRFLEEGTAWAHIDVAGMMWNAEGTGPTGKVAAKGATGFGPRLLNAWIDTHFDT
jgi:leucyl aminopeptidase